MSDASQLRRSTPLAEILKARIRAHGPISVRDFMRLALQDADHGYYRKRLAIGAAGDFITAPEISQVFGELIGLWTAVVWQTLGAPGRFNLVELGPGRGTLMADMLRATRNVAGFGSAAHVRLVDSSEALRAAQRACLEAVSSPLTWHTSIEDLGAALGGDTAPIVLIANEFLDALPVTQTVAGDPPRVRGVGLGPDGDLDFVLLDSVSDEELPITTPAATTGAIFERHDYSVLASLHTLAKGRPLAGLFIDYGHTSTAYGDTLQAVRGHAAEHPLASPGEADLTAHVDFAAVAKAARGVGFSVDGPVTQAELLGRLGVVERASRLMSANPADAGRIEAAVARLIAPSGMGSRFKAVALRHRVDGPLPAFEHVREG